MKQNCSNAMISFFDNDTRGWHTKSNRLVETLKNYPGENHVYTSNPTLSTSLDQQPSKTPYSEIYIHRNKI